MIVTFSEFFVHLLEELTFSDIGLYTSKNNSQSFINKLSRDTNLTIQKKPHGFRIARTDEQHDKEMCCVVCMVFLIMLSLKSV